jgi:hypothetical protein
MYLYASLSHSSTKRQLIDTNWPISVKPHERRVALNLPVVIRVNIYGRHPVLWSGNNISTIECRILNFVPWLIFEMNAHKMYVCVWYGSRTEERLFSWTVLTGWSLYRKRNVFSVRYELNLYILFRRNSVFKGLSHLRFRKADYNNMAVTGTILMEEW